MTKITSGKQPYHIEKIGDEYKNKGWVGLPLDTVEQCKDYIQHHARLYRTDILETRVVRTRDKFWGLPVYKVTTTQPTYYVICDE